MAISVPPPGPVPGNNPHHYATRMARADGCPDCVTNTEPPYVVIDHGAWYIAKYGCETCGHFWETAWRDE